MLKLLNISTILHKEISYYYHTIITVNINDVKNIFYKRNKNNIYIHLCYNNKNNIYIYTFML